MLAFNVHLFCTCIYFLYDTYKLPVHLLGVGPSFGSSSWNNFKEEGTFPKECKDTGCNIDIYIKQIY